MVAAFVDKALDLDSMRRFQTAEEMSEAIQSIADTFAVEAAVFQPALPRTSHCGVDRERDHRDHRVQLELA